MKVWLDDVRPAPPGWTWVKTAPAGIELLARGDVTELSLDHDLGDDDQGTGYDVLVWMEEACARDAWSGPAPTIHIHSANPVGRSRMLAAIEGFRRQFQAMRERA